MMEDMWEVEEVGYKGDDLWAVHYGGLESGRVIAQCANEKDANEVATALNRYSDAVALAVTEDLLQNL